jgi:hypothetical protein
MDIAKLTFGSDDAELDEKYGFLDKVFLKTSIYRRAKEGQRELLIGRKGAGKSAICLSLKKAFEKEGVATILIAPKTMSLRDLEQFKLSTLNTDEAYVFAWRYFLLLKIGVEIYSRIVSRDSLRVDSALKPRLKKIRRFLVFNNEIERTLFEKVWGKSSSIKRLISKVTLKAYGVEGSLETRAPEAQRLVLSELDTFQAELDSLHSVLEQAYLVVLIDKVDEIWADNESSTTAIVGLIKAVHELNTSLQRTRLILALRADIYDTLKFSDADKFRTAEERLDWSEQDLKSLIAKRGMVSAGLAMDEVNALWNSIFEFKVQNESSFQYIIRRTMRRPRELIQFCNRAKAIAQDNDHDQVYQEDILNAEPIYSKWKLKDLATEFLVQYPYLEDLLKIFEGFKASFTPAECIKRLDDCKDAIGDRHSVFKTTSSDRFLQVLFTIGFLGTVDDLGKPLFSYDDPNIILSQKPNIIVHPAFHTALGIA